MILLLHFYTFSFMEGCGKAICHFIDGRDRSPVCLKSYPGSGNTWMRGLLEKASGICTGMSDCDTVPDRVLCSGVC